jgi:hypothetical protein
MLPLLCIPAKNGFHHGLLEKADTQIAAYVNAPGAKGSRLTAQILQKHFRWTEEIRKRSDGFPDIPGKFVPGVIKSLRQKIDFPQKGNLLSSDAGPEGKRIFAEVQPNQLGTNCFSYTPEFFLLGKPGEQRIRAIFRARIVIHEMLHSYENTLLVNDVYVFDAAYPGQRVENASANVDSYACAIRDLALNKVRGFELIS